MILVDTSVWVSHFRTRDTALVTLLEDGFAGMHPFVTGELACGNLKDRAKTLAYFRALPQCPMASDDEIRHILEHHRLWGIGLGWVDLHLLASASIAGWGLLTRDRVLAATAAKVRVPGIK